MDAVVICRICGQGWTGASAGDRCPNGDEGVLVEQAVHEKFYADQAIGRAVAGKYAVIGKLGQGGFGSVYRAIQEPVGRSVAVKVIASGEANDEELRGRFFREARVVSRLSNRATVTLYDYGEDDDGALFMVFEFIDGRLLADLIAEGPLPAARAVSIVQQVLSALAEAHELGLIHRDLKPGNIMVSAGALGVEEVKVLDFGIAKMQNPDDLDDVRTREGVVLGTPRYMSPEQSQDAVLDGRSDLYAMGVILYELLVGEPPFTGKVPFDILLAHIQKPVPAMPASLGVPPAVEAVVQKAMAKTPDGRFGTATEMSIALAEAVGGGITTSGGLSTQTAPSVPSFPIPEVVAPRDVITGDITPKTGGGKGLLIAIVVLLLAGAGVATWWFTRDSAPVDPVDDPPITVVIGQTDPAKQVEPIVRLAQADRHEDAVLSMRRALENAADRKKLVAHARTLPALARVLADPSLQDALK